MISDVLSVSALPHIPSVSLPDQLIPDLRFLHEYRVISSKFKTITIEIKGLESIDTHPSEDLKALEHNIKYDYVFNNIDKNGYASDLKIKDFCDTIFKNIEEL